MNVHLYFKINVVFTCLSLCEKKSSFFLTLLEADRFYFGCLVVGNILLYAVQNNDAEFRFPVNETLLLMITSQTFV